MKWTLSAFHFLYFKNNVAHIKHDPDVSPKLRLQAALNAHFTVFFYSSSQVLFVSLSLFLQEPGKVQ